MQNNSFNNLPFAGISLYSITPIPDHMDHASNATVSHGYVINGALSSSILELIS